MTEVGLRLVQLAVLGPALAGFLWLVMAQWRWPRRLVAGLVGLAAHGAAWWVFWLEYLGQRPEWRGLSPSLLTATAVAVAEVGILFAAVRSERHASVAPIAIAALGAATSALVLAGYTNSLVLLGVVIPVPALALAAFSFVDEEARRGLLGLAAADVVALLGLSVVLARTESATIGASTGLGVGLLLAAGAVKAGAVPGVGTARLAAGQGAPSLLAAPLRGQGILLAAIAGAVLAGGEEMVPAAVAAAAAALLAGCLAAAARSSATIVSLVTAAAAAATFLALGLGGGFGVRAFLVLFPAFLLGSAAAQALASDHGGPAAERRRHRITRAAGALALGVAVGSLAGAPPGGGFPGTWMTLSLAAARGSVTPAYLILAGAALAGLGLALAGGIRVLRTSRPTWTTVVLGLAAAAALLYAGVAPVRLGIGWWLRVEQGLVLPAVVPSAGGPTLPAIGGRNLVLALAPGLLLCLLAFALGRGVRVGLAPTTTAWSTASPLPVSRRATIARLQSATARVMTPVQRLVGRPIVPLAVLGLLELAVVVLAVRLLVVGAGLGFL